jgi:signal transduction histidine kinase/putative methionine-R-sulfoxide reductase with GAF domain
MSSFSLISAAVAVILLVLCGVLVVRLRQQEERLAQWGEAQEKAAVQAQEQISGLTHIVKSYQDEKNERVLRDNLNKKLVTLARATSGMSTLPETLRRILDITSSLTNAELGSLLLLDAAGRVTDSITSLSNSRTEEAQTIVGQVMDKGLAGWVVRTKEMAYIPNVAQDERWIDLPNASYKAGSALCVPINQGHTITGVLTLVHAEVDFFRQEDKDLMQSAASQIALALGNAQIFEGQRRMLERQTSVYELLQAISNQLDGQEIVEATVQTVVQLTGWPLAAVLLPTSERGNLQVAASAGTLPPQWPSPIPLPAYPRLQRVWEERYTDNIPHVGKLANYTPAHPNLQSELIIPLRRGHQLFGLLALGQEQPFAFQPEDILLAESMAEASALALVNAELYTTLSNYTAELRTLYTVMRTVNETLIHDRALKETLEVVREALGYDGGVIALYNPTSQALEVVAHTLPPAVLADLTAEGAIRPQTIAGYAFYSGQQSLVLHNLQQDTPSIHALRQVAGEGMEMLLGHGYVACSAVLLRHQGELLGVLSLYARQPITRTSNSLALQEGIGQQVATAVANAQLFQTVSTQRGRLEAIIENSQGGLLMASPDQTIMVINEQAIGQLGLPGTRQAWMGRPLSALVAVLPAPAAVAMQEEIGRWQAGDTEQEQAGGMWELPPHTSLAWTSLPVVHEGQTLGRLFLWQDVSEQRSLERLRDDLIHTMVHDLRNPLHMIAGSLDLLGDILRTEFNIGDNEEQLLDISLQNTDRLLGLVNAILDINQLENRRLPLHYTLFEMSRTLEYIIKLMSPLAQEKEIEIEIELDKAHQVVWADRNLVERVLQNLVGNALKFTPAGGRVHIHTQLIGASHKLQIAIQDTGPGVDPDIRHRLFQKFTMGSNQPKGQGNGLGLAFCKMALEAMNEKVWLEESSAEGTTFAFTLALPPRG